MGSQRGGDQPESKHLKHELAESFQTLTSTASQQPCVLKVGPQNSASL